MTLIPNDPNNLSPFKKMKKSTGIFLAMAAVFLWGSNAVIARYLALEGVSMSVLAFLRVAIGGAVLAVWVYVSSPTSFRTSGGLLRDRWVWLAIIFYGGNMLVFHLALRFTSASVVMMLENIASVVALFGGAWLFRERITWRALLALVLALGGVFLVCLADPGIKMAVNTDAIRGNVLALLAGITWGGYTLVCRGHGRQENSRNDGAIAMMIMLLGSAILLFPSIIGSGGWPKTMFAWIWVVVLGVMHTALATVLWRLALNHISAYTASLLFLFTIVLTIANSYIFLHEQATPLMLLGAGCIVAALLTMVKRQENG